jgi:hypothetical protein
MTRGDGPQSNKASNSALTRSGSFIAVYSNWIIRNSGAMTGHRSSGP